MVNIYKLDSNTIVLSNDNIDNPKNDNFDLYINKCHDNDQDIEYMIGIYQYKENEQIRNQGIGSIRYNRFYGDSKIAKLVKDIKTTCDIQMDHPFSIPSNNLPYCDSYKKGAFNIRLDKDKDKSYSMYFTLWNLCGEQFIYRKTVGRFNEDIDLIIKHYIEDLYSILSKKATTNKSNDYLSFNSGEPDKLDDYTSIINKYPPLEDKKMAERLNLLRLTKK